MKPTYWIVDFGDDAESYRSKDAAITAARRAAAGVQVEINGKLTAVTASVYEVTDDSRKKIATFKPGGLTLQIGKKSYGVKTLQAASRMYSQLRDESGEGASTWHNGIVRDRVGVIATISYNGRVWPPGKDVPGMQPLLEAERGNPRKKRAAKKLKKLPAKKRPAKKRPAKKRRSTSIHLPWWAYGMPATGVDSAGAGTRVFYSPRYDEKPRDGVVGGDTGVIVETIPMADPLLGQGIAPNKGAVVQFDNGAKARIPMWSLIVEDNRKRYNPSCVDSWWCR